MVDAGPCKRNPTSKISNAISVQMKWDWPLSFLGNSPKALGRISSLIYLSCIYLSCINLVSSWVIFPGWCVEIRKWPPFPRHPDEDLLLRLLFSRSNMKFISSAILQKTNLCVLTQAGPIALSRITPRMQKFLLKFTWNWTCCDQNGACFSHWPTSLC